MKLFISSNKKMICTLAKVIVVYKSMLFPLLSPPGRTKHYVTQTYFCTCYPRQAVCVCLHQWVGAALTKQRRVEQTADHMDQPAICLVSHTLMQLNQGRPVRLLGKCGRKDG